MDYVRKTCMCIAFALSLGTAFGQKMQPTDWAREWKNIDELISKQSFKTAYSQTQTLLGVARKHHDSRNLLIAAYKREQIASAFMEDASDSALSLYQSILPELQATDRALCHGLLAVFYDRYLIMHRWQIAQNEETDEADADYKLWSENRFRKVMADHFAAALSDPRTLQHSDVHDVELLCSKGSDAEYMVSPTVYDLLMQTAASCSDNPDEKLRIYEQLLDFHSGENNGLVTISLELQRLKVLEGMPGKSVSLENYQQLIHRYRHTHCEWVTLLYEHAASFCRMQRDLVRAKAYCDTAVSLFPESEGGKNCLNMRNAIVAPHVEVRMNGNEVPDRDLLVVLSCRNVDTAYYRIVKQVESIKGNTMEEQLDFLLKQPVVQSGFQVLPSRSDYLDQEVYAYLPPLPSGRYCLLVSSSRNFKTDGLVYSDFICCDAVLISAAPAFGFNEGYLISRTTGRPIVGHTLKAFSYEKGKKVFCAGPVKTDSNGFYRFENLKRSSAMTEVVYQGVTLPWQYIFNSSQRNAKKNTDLRAFTDRPVYKPGDTVFFSVLCFYEGEKVASGTRVKVVLQDPNYRALDTLQLISDEMGLCQGRFHIPENGLPGNYELRMETTQNGYSRQMIRVEAYKKPQFLISLKEESVTYRFGEPAYVEGQAVSYSEVPVQGAKVVYRVERRIPLFPWYRMNVSYARSEVVASGELTTDAQGLFRIGFIPLPDSTYQGLRHPLYAFHIFADVTDINGETHAMTHTLYVGQGNHIGIVADDENSEFEHFSFAYYNYQNERMETQANVSVEKLRIPEAGLSHPISDSMAVHSLTREEFRQRFPLIAYNPAELSAANWAVERTVFSASVRTSLKEDSQLQLPRLESGIYRLKVSAVDSLTGDTIESKRIVTLVRPQDQKVPSPGLLWSSVSSMSCEPGDTLVLRVGTRYRDVTAYCVISYDQQVYGRYCISLSQETKTLRIPVKEELLGGFHVEIFSVKENVDCRKTYNITVPYVHKQLRIRMESFRDHLQPGETENWRIAIEAPRKEEAVKAALQLTMYDAALDSYALLDWSFSPWKQHASLGVFSSTTSLSYSRNWLFSRPVVFSYQGTHPTEWTLGSAIFSQVNRFMKSYAMCEEAYECDGIVSTSAYASKQANGAVMEVAAGVFTDAESAHGFKFDEAEKAEAEEEFAENNREEMLRKNLNTLAFFRPNLRTESDGSVEVSFTVPEALTRWTILGMAHTEDLNVGHFQGSLITQKSLMVQPYMPRFVREGDSLQLQYKISNVTDADETVKVSLRLNDALADTVFLNQEQDMAVPAKSSVSVSFPVLLPSKAAPRLLIYQVVARGSLSSDGEQGALPVLTQRQLVTVSRSLYLKGAGKKQYDLSSLTQTSEASASHSPQLLKVEFVSHPLWFAVQALPYVQEKENPSHIYLFNAVYTQSLSSFILERNPSISAVFRQWEKDTENAPVSPLEKNTEIKQLLSEESPWLCESEQETERIKRIIRYFDTESLQRSVAESEKRLFVGQRADGSWSWMPGDRVGNLHITQYILKGYGHMRLLLGKQGNEKALGKAVAYVDAEQNKIYRQIKKSRLSEPVNLEYLYMRSFYPNEKFASTAREAYDFFYSNALKHYTDYQDLYSRALLAMVFYRHGDRKQAEDILRRLEECALTDDEMGMYWRDNVADCWWYHRPIETQSLLIQAFSEIAPGSGSVDLMKQWLLKQKQSTAWSSDVATVDAVTALLSGRESKLSTQTPDRISVAGHEIRTGVQAGTGYQSQTWQGSELQEILRDFRHKDAQLLVDKATDNIAWGAAYYQYWEDMDKIPASETGITLRRQLFVVQADGSLSEVPLTVSGSQSALKVGQRVRMRVLISCDRNLEYVEMRENRASGLEPVSTGSGWHWNAGLSYYAAIRDASTSFFMNRLDKGKYVIEYDAYVTHSGTFTLAPIVVQCLYAPEFRATSTGASIGVD